MHRHSSTNIYQSSGTNSFSKARFSKNDQRTSRHVRANHDIWLVRTSTHILKPHTHFFANVPVVIWLIIWVWVPPWLKYCQGWIIYSCKILTFMNLKKKIITEKKRQIEPEKSHISTGLQPMTFAILVQTLYHLHYDAIDNGSWLLKERRGGGVGYG